MPQPSRKLTIGLIYLAAVMQGLALVAFPAFSGVFTSSSEFALTGAQYGAMFIPQVTLAIVTSALTPWLAARVGLRGVLLLGLGGDFLSMALLSASPMLMGSSGAFAWLCVCTGALGLGFGATVMTLNTIVEGLFPGREDGAVLTLNALLGLGTALAPVLGALFSAFGAWWALPLLNAVLAAILLGAFVASPLPSAPAQVAAKATARLPVRFWLYALAVLLYGLVETICGNWGIVYLTSERHASAEAASLALTAFWLMVTLGRVGLALFAKQIPAKWAYVAMPALLALVFQLVAHANSATMGIVAFGAAGLVCSGMLPFSISFSGSEFPSRAATMSGELIAFYQIGVGVAAFGIGPLHTQGRVEYATAFALAGGFALVLAGVAALLALGRPNQGTT